MQKNLAFGGLLLSLIFLFSACRSANIGQSNGALPEQTAGAIIQKMQAKAIDFEWFDAKAKIKLISLKQNRSVRATIRIQKDSLIWMSVSFIGLEAVRAKITPDSVYLINRLEKEYTIQPLSLLQDEYNLPADFSTIQSVLVGNPVFGKDAAENFSVEIDSNLYVLSASEPFDVAYSVDGRSYLTQEVLIQDAKMQKLEMTYQDYQKVDEQFDFSFFRDILLTGGSRNNGLEQSANVQIEYLKASFNKPANTRFSIPKSYKKMAF